MTRWLVIALVAITVRSAAADPDGTAHEAYRAGPSADAIRHRAAAMDEEPARLASG